MTEDQNGHWHVVITEPIDAAGMQVLRDRNDISVELLDQATRANAEQAFPKADAIIVRMMPLHAKLLDGANRLKLVARHGVGYDTVDIDALTRREIPLAIAGDVNAIPVAEHTLCLLLAMAKRLKDYDAAVRRGEFQYRLKANSIEIYRKTLLLLGFGRIGREVARRAQSFGMSVAVHDPLIEQKQILMEGCVPVADFRAALEYADFVSLHAPLVSETIHIMDRDAFSRMKPSACIINTARGGEIDEDALLEALVEGKIAGAALDVFVDYPPAPDNPLLKLENVLVTPHSAGLTRECAERIAVSCARNVLDAKDGALDPDLVVNREIFSARSASRAHDQSAV